VWLVLCAALTSTAEAQHGRKTRSNRTTFHVVGMVPFPGFVDSYAPALQDYLEREVGTQYEPALKFTIRQDAGAVRKFPISTRINIIIPVYFFTVHQREPENSIKEEAPVGQSKATGSNFWDLRQALSRADTLESEQ